MPSTYTNILRLELQADGENDGTWGQILNDNVIALIEDAIAATASISTTGGTTTLSTNDGADDQARRKVLDVTGALGSDAIIEVPAQSKSYIVRNRTSGSQTVEVLVAGQAAGNGVVVPQDETQVLYCDGSNVEPAGPAVPRTNTAALFTSNLAANGGSIPETDRESTFTATQKLGGTADVIFEDLGNSIFWQDGAGNDIMELRWVSGVNAVEFISQDGGQQRLLSLETSTYDVNVVSGKIKEGGTRVVESGSNSDGYWVRYSDGTQMCWAPIQDDILTGVDATANFSGNLYGTTLSQGDDIATWTFPNPFDTPPVVEGYYLGFRNWTYVSDISISDATIGLVTSNSVTDQTVGGFAFGTWT